MMESPLVGHVAGELTTPQEEEHMAWRVPLCRKSSA